METIVAVMYVNENGKVNLSYCQPTSDPEVFTTVIHEKSFLLGAQGTIVDGLYWDGAFIQNMTLKESYFRDAYNLVRDGIIQFIQPSDLEAENREVIVKYV